MADILALIALLWIINFYIRPAEVDSLSFLPAWLADKDSIALIAVFVVLFGIKNIMAFLVAKSQDNFTGRVAIRLSRNGLIHYQHSGYMEYVNTDSSILIRRIALQPFDFSQHVLWGLQQIITQLILISITIIAILIFNAKLFLLLLVILLPPAIFVFYYIKKRLTYTKERLRDDNEQSYKYMLDAIKGWVESNIYQRNDFFLQRFMRHRSEFAKHLYQSISLQHFPGRIIEIFAVLGLFILIVIAKWLGPDSGNMLITIGAFMAAAYKIIPGIVKIINQGGQIKAYGVTLEEMSAPVIKSIAEPVHPLPIHSIAVSKLSFDYGERPVLNNISFVAQKGGILGISGASGKGKTTLLNLLLGFLTPSEGKILINEQENSGETLKQYWPSISYVRQQSFFIHDTILQNITFSEKDHDKDALSFALAATGLDKLVETFPEGMKKIITENGKNISGGQQQRIAIARALYKNAGVLLLDEPFNELDEASTLSILGHLHELAAKDKIILLITHDKKILSSCNKIVSLDES